MHTQASDDAVSLLQELELEPILESIVDSGYKQLQVEKATRKAAEKPLRAADVLLQQQQLTAAAEERLQKEPLQSGPTVAATQVMLIL